MPRKKKKEVVVFITKDSYLAAIKNSINTHLYRNFYAKVNNKREDIVKNGELSCAYFVSSILVIFSLIEGIHLTVNGTEKDLKTSGWKKIKKPEIGCVLIWVSKKYKDGGAHRHMGFYIGKDKAISNDHQKGTPKIHHWTFNRGRKVESIFWNRELSS
ncbi:MAG: hypothetical protein NT039_00640 [Candidatus Berkelbacteria bacterium]|nr:hypothetical protein [Candidatus Berkelbacteria bacterium]